MKKLFGFLMLAMLLMVASPGMSANLSFNNADKLLPVPVCSDMNISITNVNATQGLQYDFLQVVSFSDYTVTVVPFTAQYNVTDALCNRVDIKVPQPLLRFTYNSYAINKSLALYNLPADRNKTILNRKFLIGELTKEI